ncbi:MAG: 5-formyltetrahydrofolate cyclo-ligase [Betaproteobacteria bacterium]|nr:5-formyltetrahydrofolate cyclo-ligase [Betaproteobacteria bacterium]MDE1982663.1 5-formyltetrahydrofolate cyclo-ligase [Betaproteobacteria bacterium]MDE2132011.1 5-formyltetrahydrofolate cyclo-ligase [Betaproteobacteria bacterium]MDE2212298.1 5-formyltetrahydrofolate cyclo-ligase [Betaproteobacteria bacterium]MDE2353682.1 5-formyltetrahydrofolate cyclo-ligase [Betaproteobacteria bacterium]
MKPSQKSELRAAVLARRDAIPEAQRDTRSRELSRQVTALPEFAAARTVMAYMPMGSEFDTRPLLQAVLSRGARLVLPRVERATKTLALHAVADLDASLQAGVWGIREPDPQRCPLASLGEVDFILMPGAAFDRQRHRMGYGGGFYDKLLSRPERRAITVAVAFVEQLVAEVPVEPHDVPVDILVSDDGLYR